MKTKGLSFTQCYWCHQMRQCVHAQDPYDLATGSPVFWEAHICRGCWLDRALGGFDFHSTERNN